jgi:hypothetical protein
MYRYVALHRPHHFPASLRTRRDTRFGSTRGSGGKALGTDVDLAARFDLDSHGRLPELGIHPWSNFWIKHPNRGQDFLTLSFGF